MAKIFITLEEAERRYGRCRRTLLTWAKEGILLFDVINPQSNRPTWLIESPEAHAERTRGV